MFQFFSFIAVSGGFIQSFDQKDMLLICESDVAGGWMSSCGKETLVGFNYVMSVCLGRELT